MSICNVTVHEDTVKGCNVNVNIILLSFVIVNELSEENAKLKAELHDLKEDYQNHKGKNGYLKMAAYFANLKVLYHNRSCN